MLFAFSLQILYHKKTHLSIPGDKKNAKKCGFSNKIPHFFEKWSFFILASKLPQGGQTGIASTPAGQKIRPLGYPKIRLISPIRPMSRGLPERRETVTGADVCLTTGSAIRLPKKNGTRERNRTSDQKFRKLLLYPLSYPGTLFIIYHCYR